MPSSCCVIEGKSGPDRARINRTLSKTLDFPRPQALLYAFGSVSGVGNRMANIVATLAVAAIASLAGTEWGPEAAGKPEQYIQFKESDVAGYGGCNRFRGPYTFDGSALKIGPLASTRMACEPAVMDAEQAWFRMLETAEAAEATPTKLILKDKTGAVIATLRRRDWD